MTAKVLMPVRIESGRAAGHQATVTRTTETGEAMASRVGSGAVSLPRNQQGDVNSTIGRSRPPTTQSSRTLATATRTTTTRTTSSRSAPSADFYPQFHADFSFEELVTAYYDCRRTKRNTLSALKFEFNLERNLVALDEELRNGTYRPDRSICFVITRPKHREVWAADFRDRIVHHLLYNRVGPQIEARFIADSCACIKGRGTLYGAQRLEAKCRSVTQGWTKPAHYLKADLANFFVSIDKEVLTRLLSKHIREHWWFSLAKLILWHDPRQDYEYRGRRSLLNRVPPHKRLAEQNSRYGLPIGNLSSQFFANVLLNELDQYVKHVLKAKHYIRYVDDFVLLHESPQWLNQTKEQIEWFLEEQLHTRLNPSKTILQPIHRGVDFVGQVILPGRRVTRRRTVNHALRQVATMPQEDLRDTVNSYFGLFRQATDNRADRLKLAREVLRRGKCVDRHLTKTYKSRDSRA